MASSAIVGSDAFVNRNGCIHKSVYQLLCAHFGVSAKISEQLRFKFCRCRKYRLSCLGFTFDSVRKLRKTGNVVVWAP